METSADQYPSAWRPFTPRGVAAFAHATFGRLFLVQLIVSLFVATATVWFLKIAWYPTISTAIDQLPGDGTIRAGRLEWTGDSPKLLAESRVLAFAVDLNHEAKVRSPAHVQVEFGRADLRVYSIFGWFDVRYPKPYVVTFNSQDLKPWWGARAPAILAIAAGATVIGLLIGWTALATLYGAPAWLIGLYFNRQLTICGAWRLSGAALMPGALFMVAVITFYGMGQLDVVRLLAAFSFHVLVGWGYVVLGTLAVRRFPSDLNLNANPFKAASIGTNKSGELNSPKAAASNPFSPNR